VSKPSLAAGAPLDLARLLETRLLVQANSGGGKSWALRRILEQTAPKVQQLVIDPEGEFATLRERFDYVICAPHDADAIATPRTAALLARRLLETGVSAILDIYDLKAHERQAFVEKFLTTLVNAPKALWRPVLIVLDEAHIFAPEAGKAESTGAVIDVATRGRKRGQSLIVATQRLAKLHKDVAAEMLNKMIGRTGLDVDVIRAAAELGLTKGQAFDQLRPLDPGEFYVFGPALSLVPTKVKIGDVVTTHPRAGDRLMQAPPAPSAKIKGLISAELADLPQQAESEIRTLEDAKREVSNLRRQLTLAEKAQPVAATAPKVDVRAYLKQIERLRAAVETLMKFVIEINARDFTAKAGVDEAAMTAAVQAAVDRATKLIEQKLDTRNREVSALQTEGKRLIERIKKLTEIDDVKVAVSVTHNEPFTVSAAPRPAPKLFTNGDAKPDGLSKPEFAFLRALWWLRDEERTPEKVAFYAGYSVTSSSFGNSLGALRSAGLVQALGITFEGEKIIAPVAGEKPTGRELREWVRPKLTKAENSFLDALIDVNGQRLDDETLCERAGYSITSSSFGNSVGRLRSIGAAQGYAKDGGTKAAEVFFDGV